jgi:hypothetical protein
VIDREIFVSDHSRQPVSGISGIFREDATAQCVMGHQNRFDVQAISGVAIKPQANEVSGNLQPVETNGGNWKVEQGEAVTCGRRKGGMTLGRGRAGAGGPCCQSFRPPQILCGFFAGSRDPVSDYPASRGFSQKDMNDSGGKPSLLSAIRKQRCHDFHRPAIFANYF